jgi:hypothetical protein
MAVDTHAVMSPMQCSHDLWRRRAECASANRGTPLAATTIDARCRASVEAFKERVVSRRLARWWSFTCFGVGAAYAQESNQGTPGLVEVAYMPAGAARAAHDSQGFYEARKMSPAGATPDATARQRSGITQPTTGRSGWPIFVHSARTAAVAVTSLLVAKQLELPEAYWAPITTLVIEQSSLGAALSVSWQRFIGTLLGAMLGAVTASQPMPHTLAIAASIFMLGLLRSLTHSDLTGYRFGAVTLAIVLLVPRSGPAWEIALHRFLEVSVGIGVALMLAVVWPERGPVIDDKAS